MKQFRVSKETDPQQLAGAVNSHLLRNTVCEITAIGPKSVVVVVKGLALLTRIFKCKYHASINYTHIQKEKDSLTGISFIFK